MSDMVPAEVPSHWLVYFGVDDTDATVAKATELGASIFGSTNRHSTGALCSAE